MKDFLLYVIADYGDLHDLAFAEVTQKLYHELNDLNVETRAYAVPAFDTVATGFALAQTAINSKLGKHHKFYVNTAPRKDDLTPRVKNSGEGLAYVKLFNDVEIVAVNSGYSLSFVKDAAVEIREIHCDKHGSQFRSRDIFPPAFGLIAHGDYSKLGQDIRDAVPDLPKNKVCYTDGYGNMKCSVAPSDLTKINGKYVSLKVNGHAMAARVAEGIFGVADGEFCFSKGSSGWTLPDGKTVEFSEVVMRGGNAARAFGRPSGGLDVNWRVIE